MLKKTLILSALLLNHFILFGSSGFTLDKEQTEDSITIKVSAINLSEDLSVLSTKNDELLFLIYELNDTSKISDPVFLKQLKLDNNHRSKVIYWNNPSTDSTEKHLLVLIERDSEITLEQFEPTVRVYFKEIIKAFHKKDYNETEKYLGDDDVLGIKEFTLSEIVENGLIKFEGIYRMDRYEYEIEFE